MAEERGNELGIFETEATQVGVPVSINRCRKMVRIALSQRTRHNWSADRTRWGPRCR